MEQRCAVCGGIRKGRSGAESCKGCAFALHYAKTLGVDRQRFTCQHCHIERPIAAFPTVVVAGVRKYITCRCRPCYNAYLAQWRRDHSEAWAATVDRYADKQRRKAAERAIRDKEQRRDAIVQEYGSYEQYVIAKKQKNLAKHAARRRQWCERNPEKVRERRAREHRARSAVARVHREAQLAAAGRVSLVYFIRCGTTGPIKIGYTEQDPEYRLKALQNGNPARLTLIGVIHGAAYQDERALHVRFAHLQITDAGTASEWFSPGPDLLAFIGERCEPWTAAAATPERRRYRQVRIEMPSTARPAP